MNNLNLLFESNEMDNEGKSVQWVEAYKYIRSKIINGEYAPGARIVEREISNEIGVSRSSVRPALHHLAAEGLTSLNPGRGATVTDIKSQDGLKILVVREALEGMAARLAAKYAKSEHIDSMQKSISKMQKMLEGNEYLDYISEVRNFHRTLYKAADNEYLYAAIKAAKVKMMHFTKDILLTGFVWDLFNGHKKILEAVEDRDPRLAEEHAREHIRLIRESFKIVIEKANSKTMNEL